jgi:elongation factor Ts
MEIAATMVKELREKTGAGFMDCKEALASCGGNMEEAVLWLRKKDKIKAEKKAHRVAADGLIGSYIHAGGKLGVLVEVNCETDFAAGTADFKELVKDICMQVAAAEPRYVTRDEIPQDVIEREKEVVLSQAKDSGKPEKAIPSIVEGKLKQFFKESCLLEQSFIRDPKITIRDVIEAKIAKIGENITVQRFVRFKLGDRQEKDTA